MSNLTIDRVFSQYTDTELNTFFDDFIANLNSILPNGISTQNGNSITGLTINETDEIAAGINSPYDIMTAVSYLVENLSQNGTNSEDDDLSNGSLSFGRVSTDTITTTPAYTFLVTEKLSDDQFELATKFGSALENSTFSMTPEGIEQFNNQYTNKATQLSVFKSTERNAGFIPIRFQQQYQRNLVSNSSAPVGSWTPTSFLRNQSVATRKNASIGGLVNKFYSRGLIQPLSNSGGATWQQTSFTEEKVDDGLSDNFTQTLITRERFEDVGIDNWVTTRSALTTVTEESFKNDEGITNGVLGWFQVPKNNPSRITFESFNEGYSLGEYPKRICGGGSSGSGDLNEITENITTQINGSTQLFSLTNDYVSGSLRVYWNGQRQIKGETITERSSTTFSTSFVPLVGQYLIVDYVKQT
tara:strand:+ start:3240 stop:4484 length:1245 start_codon:yes stop_codon:yes gene_type:complete